jgi:hypothetical protein
MWSRKSLEKISGVSERTIFRIERKGYTDYKYKTGLALVESLGIHKRLIFKLGDK